VLLLVDYSFVITHQHQNVGYVDTAFRWLILAKRHWAATNFESCSAYPHQALETMPPSGQKAQRHHVKNRRGRSQKRFGRASGAMHCRNLSNMAVSRMSRDTKAGRLPLCLGKQSMTLAKLLHWLSKMINACQACERETQGWAPIKPAPPVMKMVFTFEWSKASGGGTALYGSRSWMDGNS
jgi:hypothetical protein